MSNADQDWPWRVIPIKGISPSEALDQFGTDEQREIEIRLATLCGQRHSWWDVWFDMVAEGMKEQDEIRKRNAASAEVDRLTALLAERPTPEPEPSLTPDGALAPIPRGTAHGGMLAALRGASKG